MILRIESKEKEGIFVGKLKYINLFVHIKLFKKIISRLMVFNINVHLILPTEFGELFSTITLHFRRVLT